MKPSFEGLRKALNVSLIRNANVEIGGKPPEDVSLGEVFGNLDALGYLIVLLSLVVTMVVGFGSGMLLAKILPEPSIFYYLGVIPGVGAGFLTCFYLFRLRRR
jgi:hypothetical protein